MIVLDSCGQAQMKKIIIAVLIIFALGASGWFLFSRNKKETVSWRTVEIERGDVTALVTATGSINALTTVQVGTQVSGTIATLLVDYNSVVKKGQVIAILDTTFLVASRDDAQANVDKAQAQLNQYTREFQRTKKLYAEQVSTQVDYDQALANYELGNANLKSAGAQLQRAKINLQYATIKAPISGTVISRNVDVGQTVIASFNAPTLFTIANDLTKMEVQATIDEADIGQVAIGQSVSFTVDAYPDEIFQGRVKQVRLQPVTVQNVVNYVVTIDVPNPDLKLMPGLTANINVKVQEHKDVLKVSMSALQFTPPAEYLKLQPLDSSKKNVAMANPEMKIHVNTKEHLGTLWYAEEGTILSKSVVTGISDGTYVEVEGPIAKGDVVITGIYHDATSGATAKNPFMPKMPTRPRVR